jgi:hypothetical protein
MTKWGPLGLLGAREGPRPVNCQGTGKNVRALGEWLCGGGCVAVQGILDIGHRVEGRCGEIAAGRYSENIARERKIATAERKISPERRNITTHNSNMLCHTFVHYYDSPSF